MSISRFWPNVCYSWFFFSPCNKVNNGFECRKELFYISSRFFFLFHSVPISFSFYIIIISKFKIIICNSIKMHGKKVYFRLLIFLCKWRFSSSQKNNYVYKKTSSVIFKEDIRIQWMEVIYNHDAFKHKTKQQNFKKNYYKLLRKIILTFRNSEWLLFRPIVCRLLKFMLTNEF